MIKAKQSNGWVKGESIQGLIYSSREGSRQSCCRRSGLDFMLQEKETNKLVLYVKY
jgi:hypothetical protein